MNGSLTNVTAWIACGRWTRHSDAHVQRLPEFICTHEGKDVSEKRTDQKSYLEYPLWFSWLTRDADGMCRDILNEVDTGQTSEEKKSDQ